MRTKKHIRKVTGADGGPNFRQKQRYVTFE